VIDTDDGFLPLLARRARSHPAGLFARLGDARLSFSALARATDALAAFLRGRGAGPGDVVASMLRNGPLSLALIFALARARAIWVPINVQSRGDNLRYILDHCAPKLIIAEAELTATIRACGADLSATLWATRSDAEAHAFGDGGWSFDEPAPGADETFAIMYTSGTTGPPKGVLVSHRMLRLSGEAVALVSGAGQQQQQQQQQQQGVHARLRDEQQAVRACLGDQQHGGHARLHQQSTDVMFMWEPLYHIGGAQMVVLPLIRDVTLALVERFSARSFWADVQANGATHIHFLGGILQILLKQPPSRLDRAHGARIAWGGGCPRDVWAPFEERFGVEIRECYGMTECSSVTTHNAIRAIGSVGRPLPWFSVELIDRSGRPVAAGERGEIVVRTILPGVITRGYFRDPETTARALRDDAFHTGDLASFDSGGNMYFHGRLTDSVRVRGENVSAVEVEQVAARHPDVEDCAMIGVAAEIGEQEIKLFVKPRVGATLAPEDFSRWLADRLAPYQNPRYIAIVAEFERTASARIMKHRLSVGTDDAWDRGR
jgi:crotonobetaine/carnitine-CoA ligase